MNNKSVSRVPDPEEQNTQTKIKAVPVYSERLFMWLAILLNVRTFDGAYCIVANHLGGTVHIFYAKFPTVPIFLDFVSIFSIA